MITKLRCFSFSTAITAAMLIATGIASSGQDGAGERVVHKYYFAEVYVYSILPQKGLETLDGGAGHGSFGPTGTFGTGISRGKHYLEVEITGQQKAERFLASLTVKTKGGDSAAKSVDLKQELDLTDLQPQSIEIARDDDGRVYRVNVIPLVKESLRAKNFRAKDLGLDRWAFNGSAVIINDQDYAGTLQMTGGRLAKIDIIGLASIEFSLTAFKDALPEGMLSEGTITINHGETSVEINNVKNGENAETLKGGPYRVFVRWKEPSQTREQARALLALQMPIIKSRMNPQDRQQQGMLTRLEKMLASDRIMLISTSISDFSKSDVIEPQP